MPTGGAHAIEIRESNLGSGRRDTRVVWVDCLHGRRSPARTPIRRLLLNIEVARQVIVVQRRALTAQFTAVREQDASVAKGGQSNAVGEHQRGIGHRQGVDCVVYRIVMKPQVRRVRVALSLGSEYDTVTVGVRQHQRRVGGFLLQIRQESSIYAGRTPIAVRIVRQIVKPRAHNLKYSAGVGHVRDGVAGVAPAVGHRHQKAIGQK